MKGGDKGIAGVSSLSTIETSPEIDYKSHKSLPSTYSLPAEELIDPNTLEEAGNVSGSESDQKSKFKAILGLLIKMIGVKDIVSMRISLPAQLLDPIPNLEYWHYLDRPDFFATVGDSDEEVERMLAVTKWWLSKDLRYVNGKIVKPYNSILGEQFLCQFSLRIPSEDDYDLSACPESCGEYEDAKEQHRVDVVVEQLSHHPPVSAFYYNCPEKRVSAVGIDHVCAKFTGTTVKITAGDWFRGNWLTIHGRDDEEYHLTHPTGLIQGWLRGVLSVGICDSSVVTCKRTGLRCIIEYKDEKWFGKNKCALEGAIFRYTGEDNGEALTKLKVKHIPEEDVICRLSGSWKSKIEYLRTDNGMKEAKLLLDMSKLKPSPKYVWPIDRQSELESRRVWREVTDNILAKQYQKATKAKHEIEGQQRQKAAERKARSERWVPHYFSFPDHSGKPRLLRLPEFKDPPSSLDNGQC